MLAFRGELGKSFFGTDENFWAAGGMDTSPHSVGNGLHFSPCTHAAAPSPPGPQRIIAPPPNISSPNLCAP